MELYLVRHGQSQSNAEHIMQGTKIDKPLTEKGRRQAEATKQKINGIKFDRVFVSPLKRASETAEIIAGPQTTITFDPRLVEFDYGKWDGHRIEQLVADYPDYFDDIANFGNSWKVSGGESYQGAQKRLSSFMNNLDINSNEHVLVVSHGMTIKLWVALLLDIKKPEKMAEPDNAGVTHFSFYHQIPILKAYSK